MLPLDALTAGHYFIWCPTKAINDMFLMDCDHVGIRWSDGKRALLHDHWGTYRENTCYHILGGVMAYGTKSYYEGEGATVLDYPFLLPVTSEKKPMSPELAEMMEIMGGMARRTHATATST